jgi:hypothetical protein
MRWIPYTERASESRSIMASSSFFSNRKWICTLVMIFL